MIGVTVSAVESQVLLVERASAADEEGQAKPRRLAESGLVTRGCCGRIFLPMANYPLEYLTTTKIGEKGQLTVPKQFREDLGLGNGTPFAVLRLGDGLILLPQQQRFEELCRQVSSRLTSAGLTLEDVLATLPESRHRVYARRYGTKPSLDAARRRSRTHRGR